MGGKSSAPEAPDYVGQAQAQSAGNLNTARAQTAANRMDQATPYGSIKYTQGDGFDESGYNNAMDKYNQQEAMLAANPNGGQIKKYMQATGAYQSTPDRTSFINNPDHWTSAIQLSDTGQQLLDAYNKTSLGMANLQGGAMDRVNQTLSQPFDMSGLQEMTTDNSGAINNYNDYIKSLQPQLDDYNAYVKSLQGGVDSSTGMDAWDRATNLVRQRQNPELDRQQAALDTKLANQGLTQGSEGWGIQQGQFGQQRNDADIVAQQAGLAAQNQFYGQALGNANLKSGVAGLMGQGIGYGQTNAGLLGAGVNYGFQNANLNNTARQQQLTERTALRNMPLNELNALRAGSQVTNPTFSTPGQQGQTSGPDLLGAANSQYNAQMGNVNAQNAQTASNNQAGASVASAAIMAMAYY